MMIQLFENNFTLVVMWGYIGMFISTPKYYFRLSSFKGLEYGKRQDVIFLERK